MKLRFSHIYAVLTAIALCYLAATGYAAEVTNGEAYKESPGGGFTITPPAVLAPGARRHPGKENPARGRVFLPL